MNFDREQLLALLETLEITRPEEIDCDEFLVRVPAYLDRLGLADRPPLGYDDLLHHLRICPECLEEFEALLEAHRD